jgi:HEPN domain-containing protein
VVAESNDPEWLVRLSAAEWMQAARKELNLAYEKLRGKKHREGVAYARRSAGMALNAVLRRTFDPGYGRSYMDHLAALRDDARAPDATRAAAGRLLGAPMRSDLVALGPGPTDLADAAAVIVDYCRVFSEAGGPS